MEIEHIVPKTRGGSNRVSNLTLSCEPCNQKKSDQTAAEFGYPEVEKQAKTPLKDATAVFPIHFGSSCRQGHSRLIGFIQSIDHTRSYY